jgi:hypothetical protein
MLMESEHCIAREDSDGSGMAVVMTWSPVFLGGVFSRREKKGQWRLPASL